MNKMPKSVWCWKYNPYEYGGDWEESLYAPKDSISAKYIRADLVESADDVPLKDGQVRWVKTSKDSNWQIGEISEYSGKQFFGESKEKQFYCFSCRFDGDMPVEYYYKIGPVINKPLN